VVERRGKPLAALIGADEYRELIKLLEEVGVNDHVHGIPVRVRFDRDRYFITDDSFDLYGVGGSLDEVRSDSSIRICLRSGVPDKHPVLCMPKYAADGTCGQA